MVEADITWLAWWSDSDWIIRSVFIILMLLSLASWSMMFFKVWQFSATSKFERIARKLLHDKKVPQDIFKRLPPSTPSAHLIEELPATSRGEELKEFAGQVLREKRLELESGMTLLATVGNATPFIGLFGTVWGIMHALQGLGDAEQVSMDMIAGPVAEALVATAVGLAAAIPAVIGYNFLLRKLRRLNALIDGNLLRIITLWSKEA